MVMLCEGVQKMKVVFIASSDWSNIGYILSECLKTVGVDSVMLKSSKHHFKYPKQGIIVRGMQQVVKYAQDADIIQFMHSVIPAWFDMDFALKKKIAVFHGGSKYRSNHEKINKIFNPIIDLTIIQTPDLLNLGAKNEVWVGPAIDTSLIQPKYEVNEKLIIGHYPSSSIAKGSDAIGEVMSMMQQKYNNFEYRYSDKKVPWMRQLERISGCDIYIEKLTILQRGAPSGVWGLTALETAACADIVITSFVYVDLYKEHYGEFGPLVATNQEELVETLNNLLTMPKKKILKLKKRNRKWVETLHSYEVIGQRLKEAYETIL